MRSLLFLVTLLVAFFSSTSASITLVSNFQEFRGSSNDATAGSNCRGLYNSRIEGCSDTEFQNGNYCTSDCQQALRNMEAKLNNFCKGVRAEDESLLAAIFGRKLVESICRDNGATGPQSSLRVSTTTRPVSTRTQQTTVTKSAEAGDDEEATTTLEVTSSSSVTTTLSSLTDTSSSQAIFVPLPTPTTLRPVPAVTTIGWRERVRQEQVCAILSGGGGSPFDQMVDFPADDKERQRQLQECEAIRRDRSGGSHSHKPSSMVAIVIGVGIGLMLLA